MCVDALPPQYQRYGSEKDARIEREGSVVNVLDIEFAPPFPGDIVASSYLRETGKTWAYTQPALVTIGVEPDLIRQLGTRAYQTHISLQHVAQLRKFVQAGGAEKLAQARDA